MTEKKQCRKIEGYVQIYTWLWALVILTIIISSINGNKFGTESSRLPRLLTTLYVQLFLLCILSNVI